MKTKKRTKLKHFLQKAICMVVLVALVAGGLPPMSVKAETETGERWGVHYSYNFMTRTLTLEDGTFKGGARAILTTQYNLDSHFSAYFADVESIIIKNCTITSDGARGMFSCLSRLQSVTFDNVNTSGMDNTYQMFNGCSSLRNLNLSGLNLSNVRNMDRMFSLCSFDVLDLSGVSIGNVSAENMFYSAKIGTLKAPKSLGSKIALNEFYKDDSGNIYTELSSATAGKTLYSTSGSGGGSSIFDEPVSIYGLPVVEQTVSVEVITSGELTYQWRRDGKNISGATTSSYKLQADDVGHFISCVVSKKGMSGSQVASLSERVGKMAGPKAPTVLRAYAASTKGARDGKIINTDSSMEYSTNADFTNAIKCTGDSITGLSAGIYYVRVAETATKMAGQSVAMNIADGKAALTGDIAITGNAEFGSVLTAELSNSNSYGPFTVRWYLASSGLELTSYGETQYELKLDNLNCVGDRVICKITSSTNVGTLISAPSEVIAKKTKAAPNSSLFTVTHVTSTSKGRISYEGPEKTLSCFEYDTKSDFSNAKVGPSLKFLSGLDAGTYYIRYKAVETIAASPHITLVVLDATQQQTATKLTGTVTLSGTAKVGQTLTATVSNSNKTGTLTYQWLRSGTNISGATGSSYKITSADAGYRLSCVVKCSGMDGSITSSQTVIISNATSDAAALTGTVAISGTAKYGQSLSASVSNTNNSGTLSYQWRRDGSDISGATARTYKVTANDIGHSLSCVVMSSKETGSISSGTVTVSSTIISTVSVRVTAPVPGATPAKATSSVTGYTVASTSWSPSVSTFDYGTQYKVEVKLKASTGYAFGSSASYKINGLEVTPSYKTQTDITLSYTFDKTEVKTYAITLSNCVAKDESGTRVTKAAAGTKITVTANTPSSGSRFDKWQISGATISTMSGNTATFFMPSNAVTVSASYKTCDHSDSTKKPTCSSSVTCSVCRATISATGHSYKNEWNQGNANGHWHDCNNCSSHSSLEAHAPGSAATETTPQVCTVCGYIIKAATGHVHSLTAVAAKAATCTTNGNTAYYTCACGMWFSDSSAKNQITDKNSVVIAKKGHTLSTTWSMDANNHWNKCTVCGATANVAAHVSSGSATETTAETCTVCGYIIKAATGHTHKLTSVAAKAATCTAAGNKAYYTCTCGRWFSDSTAKTEITDKNSVVVAALGHSYETTWSKDASNHWYKCTRCGAKKSTAAHVSSGAATETKAETCTVCGYVIKAATGHTHKLTSVAAKAATCTAAGNKAYYTCSCGKWFSDSAAKTEITDKTSVVVAALGHSYATSWSSDASNHWYKCTKCGAKKSTAAHVSSGAATETKSETCTVCGYVIKPAIGHTHKLTSVAAKSATCTAAGNKAYYKCTCGKWFSDSAAKTEITDKTSVVVAALGHSYATSWSSDASNHWYKCTRCGAKKSTAAHVSSGSATETKAETCTVCGYVIKPAIGHTHKLTSVAAKSATCTAAGNKAYYTCGCGKWFSDSAAKTEITDKTSVVVAALGHSYETAWSKDASNHWHKCTRCGAKGSTAAHVSSGAATETKAETCKVCGYVIKAATGHTHKLTKVAAKNPTCTAAGNSLYYTCTCGKWFTDSAATNEISVKSSVTIAALGHSYATVWSNDASNHWHKCVRCSVIKDKAAHVSSGAATETKSETCTKCGYVIKAATGHTHKLTKVAAVSATCTKNGNKVYYKCSCGKYFSDTAATKEIVDKSSVLVLATGHKYSTSWTQNATTHYRKCTVCSAITDSGAHVYSNDTDQNCDVCNFKRISVAVIFKDVISGQWYVPYIQYAYDNGFMKGKSQDTFGTNDGITRAEFVQVLYNMEKKPSVTYAKKFADVKESDWFASAVIWANQKDIASGYTNGKFGVNDNITREQITVMLYRYAKLKGYSLTKNNTAINQFSDKAKVDSWAKDSMNWAITQGVMSGKKQNNGSLKLDPTGNATRAEAATMIKNMLDKLAK